MQEAIDELTQKARAARAAQRKLAHLSTEVKNKALNGIADALLAHWKREFVARAPELFKTRQERSAEEARIAELERLVDGGEYACAFALFPSSVEELMAVADAGELMPPKSTWFEPYSVTATESWRAISSLRRELSVMGANP